MRPAHVFTCVTMLVTTLDATWGQDGDPMTIPAIKSFIGEGFGAKSEKAPPQIQQFGQLVGVWRVEAELRRSDGSWMESAPGVWAWKYAIDGFAISDLWYQSANNLPIYMANLGRDYLLTANRIFDVSNHTWQVAWMANGAGQAMGADFGTFTAALRNGEIVMTSPPGDGPYGLQRVVFHDITRESFRWKSEYSTDDGATWNTVMRLHATRLVAP